FGVRLPVSNTRHQNGIVLSERFPDANAPWLASVADRHVFAPGQPTREEVQAYWSDVGTAVTRMRTSVPRWRRWLAVVSPASIGWRQLGRGLRTRGRRLAASARRSAPMGGAAGSEGAARRPRPSRKKGNSS